jgi:hypothetical protein
MPISTVHPCLCISFFAADVTAPNFSYEDRLGSVKLSVSDSCCSVREVGSHGRSFHLGLTQVSAKELYANSAGSLLSDLNQPNCSMHSSGLL